MSRVTRFFTQAPHLCAAALAAAAAVAVLGILVGTFHVERRLAWFTAPEMLAVKDQGLSLQEEAFGDRKLLPVYGSSEFMNDTPYAGRVFFSHAPTGFEIFIVGKAGAKTLIIAQRLAALGNKVRGKKVVIILSPTWFIGRRESTEAYDGNFSALQASELAFSSPLSGSLKRAFATEMLKYPETLEGHGLLRLELQRLARRDRSAGTRVLGFMGRSENHFLQVLDDWQTIFSLSGEVAAHPAGLTAGVPAAGPKPDWDGLMAAATKFSGRHSYETSVLGGSLGTDRAAQKLREKFSGANPPAFDTMLAESDEWAHLGILLRTIKELGAEPLFLSIPINASAFQTQGVTPEQREDYYTRLRRQVGDLHYPVRTFQEHEGDPTFFGDSMGHPSAKGWMTFNKEIDAFYHGRLPVGGEEGSSRSYSARTAR